MKIVRMLILLLMVSLPAVAAETTPAAHTKDDGGARAADMRILLNTFTAYTEEHVEGILRGLKVLSVTAEAKSGDWSAMKGLLGEFAGSGINPAAVWYARTDGRYYTVEKGLTDQNISDRPYFPRLMAGKVVVGELVISRSTGKRATVIAVPIWKDRKVIGALGVSVSADELSRMLQERTALPEDMVFYALDEKGQCSLHSKSGLLFAFPSDMGSESLKDAVKEMLSKREGMVSYDFRGRKTVFFKRSKLTGWVFAVGVVL